MKECKIVENEIIAILNEYFLFMYENVYKCIKVTGKNCLVKYVSAFFRKWYYSTLVDDTVITPAYIAEYGTDEDNVYPVIKSGSVSRIGSLSINNIKYSIEKHPICSDFKAVVNAFRSGIVLNDELQMDFSDIKNIGDITTYDVEYITYLIMLGIDLGYIEKMPSVGVAMYCTAKKADDIDNENNRDLLSDMVDAAITISASYLSDDFMGERYNITDDMIKEWLVSPKPVDKLFEKAYGEIALEISESISVEDMGNMERAITAKTYARGIVMDKWFLTPFSYYFRFIDTTYMYEYSFYDEMTFLLNSLKSNEDYYEDAIINSAIYSPCTKYKLSKLGSEFFEVEYDSTVPYIFTKMSINDIVNAAINPSIGDRYKILNFYEPEYNVYDLIISDAENEKLQFGIEVRENTTLDILHNYIVGIFKDTFIMCSSYRFYKEPESPFTEYTPEFMGLRGRHTENTEISTVFGEGEEECCYEIVLLSDYDKTQIRKLNIRLKSISKNKPGEIYPRMSGSN